MEVDITIEPHYKCIVKLVYVGLYLNTRSDQIQKKISHVPAIHGRYNYMTQSGAPTFSCGAQ